VNEATVHARRATPGIASREISIPALVQTMRRGWCLVGAIALACMLITAIGLKLRQPVDTATMIVAPTPADLSASSELAAEIERFARLAALGQMPPGIGRVPALDRYAQLFGSTTLAARLETEHHLLRIVFADQWDTERQAWHAPPGALAGIERAMLRFFGYPGWTRPDVAALGEWLGRRIEVERIGTSVPFRIEFSNPDPTFAVALLGMAHAGADGLLREQAQGRIDRQIAQVEQQLAAATDPIRRQALQALLSREYQSQALLQTEEPYAAQVVMPPATGTTPSSLNPLLALGLDAAVGVILGLFVVFLRHATRYERRQVIGGRRTLLLEPEQGEAGLGVGAPLQVRRRFGDDQFQRRPHVALEQMAAVRPAVRCADHDVRMQLGSPSLSATLPVSTSTSTCSSSAIRR
jgi:LPS O-antigen subunit length determinant protein (WzzB/FepE family)